MTDDIIRAEIRERLRKFDSLPTMDRAHNLIAFMPDLLDEEDVKDSRIRELNGKVDHLSGQIDDLHHELQVAHERVLELERGMPEETTEPSDYAGLLEQHKIASGPDGSHDELIWNDARDACVYAIPALLAELARLRRDSEVLQVLTKAATAVAGMFGGNGR